jgi:hypothetical protein
MRTETVEIGEKSYIIHEQKRKANALWRLAFQAMFTEVAALIEGLPSLDMTPAAIGDLVRQITAKVGGSVDEMAELVFAYSPELNKDRETIEEEAYDSEIMAAFTAVLKLAYPFGSLVQMVTGLSSLGQGAKATSPNSSSANTDSTTPT